MVLLDHRTHCSIEHKNTIFCDFIERNPRLASLILRQLDNLFHLAIILVLALILLNDSHGLLHLPFIVEIHFNMDALTSNMIEQWFQLIERHPTSHNALTTSENPIIEVIPFGRTTLGLTHAWRPLDGIQFFNFQQGIEMMHRTYAIEMIECIVYLLTLFSNERLYETAIVIDTDHRGDVAL